MKYYGISRGETGQYGIGDIVEGTSYVEDSDGKYINGEPCYHVFTIVNGEPQYVD